MASVWCWVQIWSRLTQCCLSFASVAVKGERHLLRIHLPELHSTTKWTPLARTKKKKKNITDQHLPLRACYSSASWHRYYCYSGSLVKSLHILWDVYLLDCKSPICVLMFFNDAVLAIHIYEHAYASCHYGLFKSLWEGMYAKWISGIHLLALSCVHIYLL